MNLKKMDFRNLYCFGNEVQTINFNKESSLNQILGTNGIGKTTIMRIIKLLVYCETDGIKINEIANQINGKGWGQIEFESKNSHWKVVGDFGSNATITIFKDEATEPYFTGKLDVAKKKLREDVVDMPYYIFSNVISLSIHDFKSFINMNAKDSKNIRDRIFSFHVINGMMELLRKQMYKDSTELQSCETKIAALQDNVANSQIEFDRLKAKFDENNTDKIKKIQEEIDGYNLELESWNKTSEELQLRLKNINLRITYYNYLRDKNEVDVLKKENEVALAEISKDEIIIKEKKNELTVLQDEFEFFRSKDIIQQINQLNENLKTAGVELDKLTTSESEHQKTVDTLNGQIKQHNDNKEFVTTCNNLKSGLIELGVIADCFKTESANYPTVKTRYDLICENETKLNESERRAVIARGNLEKDIKLYESGKCPTCATDLTSGEHSHKLEDLRADLDALEQKEKNLISTKNTLLANKTQVGNLATESKNKIDKYKNEFNFLYSKTVSPSLGSKFDGFLLATKQTIITIENFSADELISKLPTGDIDDINVDEVNKKLEQEKSSLEVAKKSKQEAISSIDSSKQMLITYKSNIADVDETKLNQISFKFDSREKYTDEIKVINQTIEKSNVDDKKLKIEKVKLDIANKESKLPNPSLFETIKDESIDINLINVELDQIKINIEKVGNDIKSKSDIISNLKFRINQIKESKIDEQLEGITNIIRGFNTQIEGIVETKSKLNSKLTYFKQLEYLYSDEGIKAFILKDIMPSINREIKSILNTLGVNLTLEFDEEFTTHVFRFGKEVSIKSISKGQGDMLNCATIFAMTKILKMKYGSVNLVFYDEIFSSLAADVRPIMLEILKHICCEKLKLQVFIINHSYLPSQYFDSIFHVYSRNNFSYISEYTVDEFEKIVENNRNGIKDDGKETEEFSKFLSTPEFLN